MIFSIIILTPNILAMFLATDVTGLRAHLIYVVCSLCWFFMPSAFFRLRGFFAFHSVTILFGLIECTHLIINKATTSLLFAYTIIIAEPGEAFELFFSAWPIVLIALILWLAYLAVCFICLPNIHIIKSQTRYISATLSIAVMILIIVGKPSTQENYEGNIPVQERRLKHEIISEIKRVFPYNHISKICDIARLKSKTEEYDTATRQTATADCRTHRDSPITVVFVQGETARFGNFSINGYGRKTTPLLSSQSNLINFDSIYSVANLTTVSVPLILNRATPENARQMKPEENLIEVFRAAGFHTSWIANQSFGNRILMNISGRCDYTKYMQEYDGETDNGKRRGLRNQAEHAIDGCMDMEMMNYIMPVISETGHGKKFMFIHTLGSHFKYSCRYPDDFSIYRPDSDNETELSQALDSIRTMLQNHSLRKDHPLLNSVRTILTNSYDNSILYTDCFLHTLIEYLEQQHIPCIMMYVSDHGENLLDDERMLFLHATYAGSIYEYHVPMFIWYSDAYGELYPEHIEQLKANSSCRTSTMTVFNTLIDMAGIDYPGTDSTLCLSSPRLERKDKIAGLDANLNVIELPEK